MLPSKHMIYGLLFSLLMLILSPSIGFSGFIIIFLSSVLIDVDHYILYVYNMKKFNFTKAFNYFLDLREKAIKNKECKVPLLIFHTIEFTILLWLLSFIFEPFLYISFGFAFHMVLDFIDEFDQGNGCMKHFSLIYYWFFRKSKISHK